MDSEKIAIFKVTCGIMFLLGLIIVPMSVSFNVGIIFVSIIVIMLILIKKTSTGFVEIFKWYKAKRKGKKYYGYIYQVIERDKYDDIKEFGPNMGQHEIAKLIGMMSGILVLKIILCDEVTMETTLIEYKITEGTRELMYFRDKQYNYVYKYKDNYYMMPSDVIPKFIVPKNKRFEIKNKLEKIVNHEV